jgi:hypothetical protein
LVALPLCVCVHAIANTPHVCGQIRSCTRLGMRSAGTVCVGCGGLVAAVDPSVCTCLSVDLSGPNPNQPTPLECGSLCAPCSDTATLPQGTRPIHRSTLQPWQPPNVRPSCTQSPSARTPRRHQLAVVRQLQQLRQLQPMPSATEGRPCLQRACHPPVDLAKGACMDALLHSNDDTLRVPSGP